MTQAAAMAKRSWWIDKKHVLHCYSSSRADCRVTSLVDLPEVSDFYDPELGRATNDVNRHLHALAQRKPRGKEPAVVIVEGGPLLAWTQPSKAGPAEDGAVTPDDHPDTIRKALRLKAGAASGHKRSWVMLDHKVWCYASPRGDCVVSKFWESLEAREDSFHDPYLSKVTREVNAILDKLREADDSRGALSFVLVENALLLMQTEPGIGPDDEPQAIRQNLGLRD